MSWRNGTGLSPEDKCLLLLARGRLIPQVEGNARSLLGQPLAWPLILRQAQAHGVVPLLTRNLERLGFPGVPADVRRRLEALDRLNAPGLIKNANAQKFWLKPDGGETSWSDRPSFATLGSSTGSGGSSISPSALSAWSYQS